MPLATFRRRAPAGPNAKAKKAAVRAYLKANPGISRTQTDDILLPAGHTVLWAVPYTPELQPIELLWSRVKNKVATQALLRRSTEECRVQAGEAFDDVSAAECEKLVTSVHKWITRFMRNDKNGSLRHFKILRGIGRNRTCRAACRAQHSRLGQRRQRQRQRRG